VEDPPTTRENLKQISLLVACVLFFKPLIFIPLTFPLTNNKPLSTLLLLPYQKLLSPKELKHLGIAWNQKMVHSHPSPKKIISNSQ
jgi:hypothetical protein